MDDRVEFLRSKIKNKYRIHVLRLLIYKYYLCNKPKLVDKVENIMDSQLRKYEFHIENIIDRWREVVPDFKFETVVCNLCGYRAPFCLCGTCSM